MEKSTEISLSDVEFISWLISRLQHLHGYASDCDIISRLLSIKDRIVPNERQYSDEDLDKIISQYFVDFTLVKDDSTSMGYTDTERINLRNAIKHIIQDINNNIVPKEFILH